MIAVRKQAETLGMRQERYYHRLLAVFIDGENVRHLRHRLSEALVSW